MTFSYELPSEGSLLTGEGAPLTGEGAPLTGEGAPLTSEGAPLQVRPEIAVAHRGVWRRLAEPGGWWTGRQRIEIAAQVRAIRPHRSASDGERCFFRTSAGWPGRTRLARCPPRKLLDLDASTRTTTSTARAGAGSRADRMTSSSPPPYKAGTTWTQAIVANLLFPDGDFPSPAEVSRGARLIKSAENANETLPQARKVPRGPVEPRSTA